MILSKVDTNKARNPQEDNTGNTRKTGKSFELHPSLIVDDMLEDTYSSKDMTMDDPCCDIDISSLLGSIGQDTGDSDMDLLSLLDTLGQ